jgi:hypothetical protein
MPTYGPHVIAAAIRLSLWFSLRRTPSSLINAHHRGCVAHRGSRFGRHAFACATFAPPHRAVYPRHGPRPLPVLGVHGGRSSLHLHVCASHVRYTTDLAYCEPHMYENCVRYSSLNRHSAIALMVRSAYRSLRGGSGRCYGKHRDACANRVRGYRGRCGGAGWTTRQA